MVDIDGEEFTPEDLANYLFYELPAEPCSLKLLPYSHDMDKDAASFLFEMLITIYMEGMMEGKRLYKMLQTKTSSVPEDDDKKIDVLNLTIENLYLCEQWIKSLGFMIYIEENNEDEYVQTAHDYCKILLRDNPNDTGFFYMKNIKKPYHFVLCAKYKPTDKIENIRALFYKPKKRNDDNDKNKVYAIKFKPLVK